MSLFIVFLGLFAMRLILASPFLVKQVGFLFGSQPLLLNHWSRVFCAHLEYNVVLENGLALNSIRQREGTALEANLKAALRVARGCHPVSTFRLIFALLVRVRYWTCTRYTTNHRRPRRTRRKSTCPHSISQDKHVCFDFFGPLFRLRCLSRFANLCVEQIKFQAPGRFGIIPLMVFVKSPVFVGVDCECSASFRVYRHDELREDEDAGDW